AGDFSVFERAGRGEGGKEREDEENRGMEEGEFIVAGEREVDVAALEVEPAVAAAVENAVVGFVDFAISVRPGGGLAGGIHGRMHRTGKKAAVVGGEDFVGEADGFDEIVFEFLEIGGGSGSFKFENVG